MARSTRKSTRTSRSLPELRSEDERPKVRALLKALKARRAELEALLEQNSGPLGFEDPMYRLYHWSFKVYGLQQQTLAIVELLRSLTPRRRLNGMFQWIVLQGTGKTWVPEHNSRWMEETRPILEAWFHARYFLEMAVKYGRELEKPPAMMPSGWGALLYLFGLR